MNAPSPWSYHQKQTAVAIATNSTANATRLRNSRRCAIRVIVASGSRGGRRLRPDVLTGEPSWGYRSGATVGHAGLVRPRAQLGRAGLQGARLGLGGLGGVLGGQVGLRRRGGRRDGVGAHRRGGRGVLGAHVVVLHALHLALEDPQRTADRARRVGQLLVPEEQQDGEDDQNDLRGAEVHRVLLGWDGRGDATPGCAASRPSGEGETTSVLVSRATRRGGPASPGAARGPGGPRGREPRPPCSGVAARPPWSTPASRGRRR